MLIIQHTGLIKACQGSCETNRTANTIPTGITRCNRSSTHQGFNHLVVQLVRKRGKDNMLLSWPPLLSQIYGHLSNFSIYSAAYEGGRESSTKKYPWQTLYLSLLNIFWQQVWVLTHSWFFHATVGFTATAPVVMNSRSLNHYCLKQN